MTAVVAVEYEGGVVVGCDSAITTDDGTRDLIDEPKWWRRGAALVAYAGDLQTAQAIKTATVRHRPASRDPALYVGALALKARDEIKRLALSEDVSLLVALRGRVYVVELSGFARSAHGYAAIGSGAPFALGSLASTKGDAHDRVTAALAAAARHSATCAPPFRVEFLASK